MTDKRNKTVDWTKNKSKIKDDSWMLAKMGVNLPINWLMKIATNLDEFRLQKHILSKVYVTNPITHKRFEVFAVWDTGATETLISKKLAKAGKFPIGNDCHYVMMNGSNHTYKTQAILLNFEKENQKEHPLYACIFEHEAQFDVVIGLDILTQGRLVMDTKDGIINFEFTAY